MSEVCFRQFHG